VVTPCGANRTKDSCTPTFNLYCPPHQRAHLRPKNSKAHKQASRCFATHGLLTCRHLPPPSAAAHVYQCQPSPPLAKVRHDDPKQLIKNCAGFDLLQFCTSAAASRQGVQHCAAQLGQAASACRSPEHQLSTQPCTTPTNADARADVGAPCSYTVAAGGWQPPAALLPPHRHCPTKPQLLSCYYC
jgi:hypothetical protein